MGRHQCTVLHCSKDKFVQNLLNVQISPCTLFFVSPSLGILVLRFLRYSVEYTASWTHFAAVICTEDPWNLFDIELATFYRIIWECFPNVAPPSVVKNIILNFLVYLAALAALYLPLVKIIPRVSSWHITPSSWNVTPSSWNITPSSWHITPSSWHITR